MPWHFHPESDCYFWSMADAVEQCDRVDAAQVPDAIRAKPLAEVTLRSSQLTAMYSQERTNMTHTIEGEARVVDADPFHIQEEAFQTRTAVGDPEAAAALPATPTVTDEKLVKIYVNIRDAKSAFKKAFEAEMEEKYEKPLRQVGTELKARMQARTNEGLKTKYGTVYIAETMKVTCQDWGIFYSWAKKNDVLENFLEQRIKQGEVKTYMDDHKGELPPGVSVFRETEARVRKPKNKVGPATGSDAPEDE